MLSQYYPVCVAERSELVCGCGEESLAHLVALGGYSVRDLYGSEYELQARGLLEELGEYELEVVHVGGWGVEWAGAATRHDEFEGGFEGGGQLVWVA